MSVTCTLKMGQFYDLFSGNKDRDMSDVVQSDVPAC